MHLKPLLTLAAAALLAGCSTYSLPRYAASADTVAALRSSMPGKASVGAFSMSASSTPNDSEMCRGTGPIKPPDGQTYAQYMQGALRSELIMAAVYDERAPIELSGNVDNIAFSSNGYWQIGLTITSTNGRSLQVSERYEFPFSFLATDACAQTAQAGMGAIQNIVRKAVTAPTFRSLVSP